MLCQKKGGKKYRALLPFQHHFVSFAKKDKERREKSRWWHWKKKRKANSCYLRSSWTFSPNVGKAFSFLVFFCFAIGWTDRARGNNALFGKQPRSPTPRRRHNLITPQVNTWISGASEALISDAHHTAASRDEAFAAAAAKGNDHHSYCQPPLPGGVFGWAYLRLGGRKWQLYSISPGERFSSGERG